MMKTKLLAILLLVAAVTAVSCKKDETSSGKKTDFVAVALNTDKLLLGLNESFQFKGFVLSGQDLGPFIFTSSNPSVVEVSGDGLAVAKGTGTAEVSALVAGKYAASCDVRVESVVDLSTGGTANCYIIPAVGVYRFPAVKGNQTGWKVSGIQSMDILWKSFGTSEVPGQTDLISRVSYDSQGITVATGFSFACGNAVVAARNGAGDILWSWHLWLCEGYDPSLTGQTYANAAGVVMDRNLGAASSAATDAQAFGLLYQWGRKDPFPGSSSVSAYEQIATSPDNWALEESSAKTDTAYAAAHPTVFLSASYDWCHSSDYTKGRWYNSAGKKTAHDPCPVGWKVPVGGENGLWGTAHPDDIFRSSQPGYWTPPRCGFKGILNAGGQTDPDIWYPLPGYRTSYGAWNVSTDHDTVGWYGKYWSTTPRYSSSESYVFEINDYKVWMQVAEYRAAALSVRCVKE